MKLDTAGTGQMRFYHTGPLWLEGLPSLVCPAALRLPPGRSWRVCCNRMPSPVPPGHLPAQPCA